MTNNLPRMHICENCGFKSTRATEFEMVGNEKLCRSCVAEYTKLFFFEADHDIGLIRGRSISLAHESLASRIGLENITVFRTATEADIARVEAQSGRVP